MGRGFAVVALLLGFGNLNAKEIGEPSDLAAYSPFHIESESAIAGQKMHVEVALSDLYVQENEILVQIEGDLYPVQGLACNGGIWTAIVLQVRGCCQRGHSLCSNCNMCHVPSCRYFVKYCNLWK